MAIKVGFSTSVCPGRDIHEIASQADEMGFYGVELGTVRDELHLPDAEDLRTDQEVEAVRKLFEEKSVEIVSLASKYSMDARRKHVQRRCFARTVENIELAGKLRCPYVRVPLGAPAPGERAGAALARQIGPLSELARIAAANHVTLLVCNSAGFAGSRWVWLAVDGVSHPGLACAWNPLLGMIARESSTLTVPRLGARLKMVQAGDAEFNGRGEFLGYRPIGRGSVDYPLTVDLLKGVLFDGYLMLDWAKERAADLPDPDQALPEALAYLLERIKHTAGVLSAYKNDKKAPNWQGAATAFVARTVASAAATQAEDDAGAEAQAEPSDAGKIRVPRGGDPEIARRVAEAVKKVRAARAAKEG